MKPRGTRAIKRPKVSVTISVADDYLDQFDAVVKRSEAAGLQVEQQLETLGIISGLIDPEKVADLYRAAGVSDVEESREYQLPPPDSPIQ